MVLKYAWSPEVAGAYEKWSLKGWSKKSLTHYERLSYIPQDSILICSHFAPWWEPLASWIRDGRPWIEIEYGYWGPDLPRRATRRVTYCGHHNTTIRPRPFSRAHRFNVPQHRSWKTQPGQYVLVVEPHGEILLQRTGQTLGSWKTAVTDVIKQYWPGAIEWRPKAGNKATRFQRFQQQLEQAHAVVGERTMACAEACLLGVPGYSLDLTISTLLMGPIENLAQPQCPDRQDWWDHICWSQFDIDEFVNGEVADLVEQYQIKGTAKTFAR